MTENSRPVELAQLHEAKLGITRPVLKKGLLGGGDARGNLLERGKMQFGELNTHGCVYI